MAEGTADYSPDNDRLLTRAEVAERLRLRPQSLAKRECLGQPLLPVHKIGGAVRYKLSDLENLISGSTRHAEAAIAG